MELRNVTRAVRRHWIVSLLAFGVVMALGLGSAYLPADRYEARSVVLVQPDPDAAPFQVQVVGLIVPSLIAQAESQTLADKARARLPEEIRAAPVKVETVDADGAGVLTITASSTRQDAVAPWATAFAEELAASPTGAGYVELALLDPARPPSRPYAPQRQPIVVSAVLLGMIAAVLAAIGAAAYRRRVDEVEEIRSRFGTKVLGELPTLRDLRRHGTDVIFSNEVAPEVIEALQSLRANVEFLMHDRTPRTIAVVSATAGEGKSTISAALAWALASVGEQVIAIDADLRRPTLHDYLHGRQSPGVASADVVPIDRLMQRTRLPTLKLLPAGIAERHPAEVLRANLPIVLDAMADETIVIDCPPMEGFAETGSITSMASAVILVIDRRRSDLLDVERSLAVLHDRGAEVLGIVINRSNRKSAAGRYYYDTALEPQLPKSQPLGNGAGTPAASKPESPVRAVGEPR